MKKAGMLIELLIAVVLISFLMLIMIRVLVNINNNQDNRSQAIESVINSSEQQEFDSIVTINNGMQLQIVSQDGYILEYLK